MKKYLLSSVFFIIGISMNSCQKDENVKSSEIKEVILGDVKITSTPKLSVANFNFRNQIGGAKYEIYPERYIWDGLSIDDCNWERDGEYIQLEEEIDEQILVLKWYNYKTLRMIDRTQSKMILDGITDPGIIEYLDCWCKTDPVQVVRKIR